MCQKDFLFFPQRSKRFSVAIRYRFELSLSWFINVSFNKMSEKMSWKPRTNGDNFPARGDGKHKEIRYRTSREKDIFLFYLISLDIRDCEIDRRVDFGLVFGQAKRCEKP